MERKFHKPYTHRRFASRKDYKHVLGTTPLPAELLMLTPILNQGQENACTAYSAVAIRESMTGNAYDPEGQWKVEQVAYPNSPDGITLEEQLAVGRNLGFGNPVKDKAFAYFFITDGSFDGIRRTLAQTKAPLSAGLNWYSSFDTADGIMPHAATGLLGGHNVKLAGFKTINGVDYIVVQNSWGEGVGDKGLFYFDKFATENYLTQFGAGYWSDDPTLPIARYGILFSLYQNIIALMQKLFGKTNGTYPPKPIQPDPIPIQTSRIGELANAIAKAEGSNPKFNNPGNLKYSTLTASWGAVKGFNATDGGIIAKFPRYQIGFQALCNFLTLGCENELVAFHQARTLAEFTKVYAGNPPESYLQIITESLKVAPDIQISTLL